MEIKATLDKPYTKQEKLDFIYLENRRRHHEIRETELALEAWGYTSEEIEQQQKERKIFEINEKISELEQKVTDEILFGNEANIKIYKDIIEGLKETRDSLID